MSDIVFVGVTTSSSLVNEVWPAWQSLLGSRYGLRSVDIGLDADDAAYVALLDELRSDGGVVGAVVTTHKVRLLRAGRAHFARLDPLASSCEEVNAIRRTPQGLHGFARDPISVGRVVDRIWPSVDGNVVCLGAGGTAVALGNHLSAMRPSVQFACADPNPAAIEQLVRIVEQSVVAHVGNGPWDDLVSAAPPGSLIVNATGLGKDRPGSPITDQVRFPRGAVVWELNYRGELELLRQARLQVDRAELSVHDGWQLFCHGWAAALSAVLDLPDSDSLGDQFALAAEELRPRGK